MKSERLLSLDVLRGITIVGMILVNNPGTWESIYAPLRHAEWNGLTPTDLVFPFFMFIMGVSMSFALSRFDHHFSRGFTIIDSNSAALAEHNGVTHFFFPLTNRRNSRHIIFCF